MIPESPLCPKLNANMRSWREMIQKHRFDWFHVQSGKEGRGKTMFSEYMCSQMDPNFSAKQAVYEKEQLYDLLNGGLDKGQSVLIEEAVNLFFNRNWQTRDSRELVALFMIIRKLSLFFCVNIYKLRYLDVYIRDGRLCSMAHVRTVPRAIRNGLMIRERGYFNFYTYKAISQYSDPTLNYRLQPAFNERFPDITEMTEGRKLFDEIENKKDEYIKKMLTKAKKEGDEEDGGIATNARESRSVIATQAWARKVAGY